MACSYLLLLFALVADAQHGGGGGGGGGGGHQHVHYPPNFYLPDTQHHIDFEIEHIIIPSVGYQSHLCLDLLLVDCRTHVTVGDEMVCGTDGVTYANHCKFVHAACQYENLHVHNHGACPPGFSTTTIAPGGSMATGSQSGSGTTAPSSAYIQSMFCRNKEFIGCPATFNIVCGSNGLFYPNSCELSKAVCDAPSLVEVPCSQSQSTQPPLPTTTTPARTTTHAGPIPIIG